MQRSRSTESELPGNNQVAFLCIRLMSFFNSNIGTISFARTFCGSVGFLGSSSDILLAERERQWSEALTTHHSITFEDSDQSLFSAFGESNNLKASVNPFSCIFFSNTAPISDKIFGVSRVSHAFLPSFG